jgi:hypothetical protein
MLCEALIVIGLGTTVLDVKPSALDANARRHSREEGVAAIFHA